MEHVWEFFGSIDLKTVGIVSLRIVLTVALALVATRIMSAVIHRWLDRISPAKGGTNEWYQRVATLAGAGRSFGNVLVWTIAVLVILSLVGLNIGPILAGAGIAGVALGLGAQHLVRDILSGIIILVEDQFTVGDVISIAGLSGTVDSINLRRTVLRDVSGNVHVVPNGKIETVTNMTRDWSVALVDVAVAYRENTERVIALLYKIGEEIAADRKFAENILEPLEVSGVQELAEAAVIIRCRFKTKPGTQWALAREFRRLVQRYFSAEGIEIPLPRLSVYMRNDEAGLFAGAGKSPYKPGGNKLAGGDGSHLSGIVG